MTAKKRIAYLVGSLDKGGCEVHLSLLLPELVCKNYDVQIFCLAQAGIMAEELRAAGIKVHTPKVHTPKVQLPQHQAAGVLRRAFRLLALSFQFYIFLLSYRPQIVHMFLPASYWFGGLFSFLWPFSRYVMSRRSLNAYFENARWVRPLETFLHSRMDCVLGNSQAVVTQLLEEGAPPAKTRLIYNGVIPAKNTVLKSRKDQVVLTIVANLIPYKGHQVLLDALGQVKAKTGIPWILQVVGRDDGIGSNLQAQAEGLDISGQVHFLGMRSDVMEVWQQTDIGLLTSFQEGFSNAILEAMNASVPMIVTDVGGNAEAVLDQETGLVVPANDASKLAEAILALLENKEKRDAMGKKARVRLVENFSLERCVKDYETVYERLF